MTFQKFLLVGIGGFFGAISRFAVVRLVDANLIRAIPYGTLTVNIIGSFILGLLYGLVLKRTAHAEVVTLVLGVGFCGGFTTFSTFAWENLDMFQSHQALPALLYMTGSFIGGVLAVGGGFYLGKTL